MRRAMSSRIGAVLVAVAVLFAVVPEAGAAGPVQTLSAAGQDAFLTDIGIATSGATVTTWTRSDGSDLRVQARRRAPNGTLGPIITLSVAGKDAAYPRIAVAPDGDAIVAWMLFGVSDIRVQTRRISAAGAVGPIRTITPAATTTYLTDVDIHSGGDAVVGLNELAPAARARLQIVRANDTLPAVQTLGGDPSYFPSAEFDSAGNVIAAWYGYDGANYRVQTRRRTAAGSLTPTQYVSAAGNNVNTNTGPQISVAADGVAVLSWTRHDGSHYRVQTRKRTLAGTLSPIATLSVAGTNAYFPVVAVDDDGDAIVAWQLDPGGVSRVQARRRTSVGSLSPIQTLSLGSVDGRMPAIAMDAQGDAAITWFAGDVEDSPTGVVQTRVWRTTGMGSTQTLSASGTHQVTQNLLEPGAAPVAVSSSGVAVATWSRDDGSGDARVQVSPFTS